MQPIPYLFFPGTCAQAMAFYSDIFGGEADVLPFTAMPEDVRAAMPDANPDAVMHAALKVGEGWIYASDDISPTAPDAMAGCSINVSLPTPEEAREVFDKLAAGGHVRMKLEPAFWTPAFGTLTDKFGVRWMVMADGPTG